MGQILLGENLGNICFQETGPNLEGGKYMAVNCLPSKGEVMTKKSDKKSLISNLDCRIRNFRAFGRSIWLEEKWGKIFEKDPTLALCMKIHP